MSSDDRETTEAAERSLLEHRLLNADRTIDKAQEALQRCEAYFGYQAQMNAAGHLSDRVMYPPIHASITSVLMGIDSYREGGLA